MAENTGNSSSDQMNQDTKKESAKGKTSVESARRNPQGGKENPPNLMQKKMDVLPLKHREPLQPTSSNVPVITCHFRKRRHTKNGTNQEKKSKAELYSMTNSPHGYCLIINNYDYTSNSTLQNREGTDKDEAELARLFKKMGFVVEVRNDLQALDIQDVLKEFASKDHSKMDAFVCCVLSHGKKGSVLGVDGEQIPLCDLTRPFAKCRTLASKPKLFFIQACQGSDAQLGMWVTDGQENTTEEGVCEEDAHAVSLHSVPIEADFLIGMSTVECYQSFRHTQEGSIYIQELCSELENGCSQQEDMHTILTRVNSKVSSKDFRGRKQMPEIRYTLTKKLVLTMKQIS